MRKSDIKLGNFVDIKVIALCCYLNVCCDLWKGSFKVFEMLGGTLIFQLTSK